MRAVVWGPNPGASVMTFDVWQTMSYVPAPQSWQKTCTGHVQTVAHTLACSHRKGRANEMPWTHHTGTHCPQRGPGRPQWTTPPSCTGCECWAALDSREVVAEKRQARGEEWPADTAQAWKVSQFGATSYDHSSHGIALPKKTWWCPTS